MGARAVLGPRSLGGRPIGACLPVAGDGAGCRRQAVVARPAAVTTNGAPSAARAPTLPPPPPLPVRPPGRRLPAPPAARACSHAHLQPAGRRDGQGAASQRSAPSGARQGLAAAGPCGLCAARRS